MARPRPRRKIIDQAIVLTRAKRGVALIPEGQNGITVDGTLPFIIASNRKRDLLDQNHQGYVLRQLVREVAHKTGMALFGPDSGRRYAYEVVTMKYYNLLSQYKALVLRRRRMSLAERRRERDAQEIPPLVLTAA